MRPCIVVFRSQCVDLWKSSFALRASIPFAFACGANDDIPSMVAGALWSIGLSFPIAAFMALVYRFPIPFAGYKSGVDAVLPSLIAVVLYGLTGGFVALGIAGAIGGLVIGLLPGTRRNKNMLLFCCSAAFTTCCLFVLAILDKIIGPW